MSSDMKKIIILTHKNTTELTKERLNEMAEVIKNLSTLYMEHRTGFKETHNQVIYHAGNRELFEQKIHALHEFIEDALSQIVCIKKELHGHKSKLTLPLHCLQIKILALQVRNQMITQAEMHACNLTQNTKLSLRYLLDTIMMDEAPQSDLKEDPLCQRELHYLYLIMLEIELSTQSLPGKEFAANRYLQKILIRCSDPFIKLTILQSLLYEYCRSNGVHIDSVLKNSLTLESSIKALISRENKEPPLSLAGYSAEVECAAGHLIAYQFEIMYHHVLPIKALEQKKNKGNTAERMFNVAVKALRLEQLKVYPELSEKVSETELRSFIKKDTEVLPYLTTCLNKLIKLDLSKIPKDASLIAFLSNLIDLGRWLAAIRAQMYLDILNKGTLTAALRQVLLSVCEQSNVTLKDWTELFNRYNRECVTILSESSLSEEKKRVLNNQLTNHEKTNEDIITRQNVTTKEVIDESRAILDTLEKAISKNASDLMKWETSQNPKRNKVKEHHTKTYYANTTVQTNEHTTVEESLLERKPPVEVKFNPLSALELLDKKLSLSANAMSNRLATIHRMLKRRIDTQITLPSESMSALERLLKLSLTEIEESSALRLHYNDLYQAMDDDMSDLKKDVARSQEYLDQQLLNIKRVLSRCMGMLTSIIDQAELEKEEFIISLGKQEVTNNNLEVSNNEIESLSPDELYKLGWAKFIELGRLNKEKGLGPSVKTLEKRYLCNFINVYLPKLETLSLETLSKADKKNELDNFLCDELILPEEIKAAFRELEKIPGQQYLVGSALNELLAGNTPDLSTVDLDFITSCTNPEQIFPANNRLRHCPHEARLYQLQDEQYMIDLMISNKEDARLSNKELLQKDAYNRHFTISSLHCDKNGRVYDFTGMGMADIKTRTLRTTQNAIKSLASDPIRIAVAMKKICQGNTPCSELDQALLNWVPSLEFNQTRFDNLVKKHLNSMSLSQQRTYVAIYKKYSLLEKIFNINDGMNLDETLKLLKSKVGARQERQDERFFSLPQVKKSNELSNSSPDQKASSTELTQ